MKEIKWLKHAGFKIISDNNLVLVFDPYNAELKEKADYIFISHSHYDHFSEDDIKTLVKSTTKIFASGDCSSSHFKITNYFKPYQKYEDENLKVTAIPAYNVNKSFHPKSKNWLGFVVEIDHIKIYHAGDTDLIEEMKDIQGVDLALVPVGGTYTMDAKEAAKAVNEYIKPKKAIPMHWGSVAGSIADAKLFVKSVNCETEILNDE
ncbi:MAG TPA: MBL fold metallo-hydrolase [bacterium]|nr:MBL fold metallo-hydrolase [bacterium]HOL48678.1 MBL fold metallo-hydrolase [bacterium]HPQ19423.1 MBL fold metallo-hydrolase [bacterium]